MAAHRTFQDRSKPSSVRVPSAIRDSVREIMYLIDRRDPDTLAFLKSKGVQLPPPIKGVDNV